jgi:hypothetical protein
MFPPILVLILLFAITGVAALADAYVRRARAARLAGVAKAWQMSFTAEDRFQLTPRIAAHFPLPGAADVVVRDLVYGQEEAGRFRYYFTIEYTLGVLRTKRRRVAVGMLVETGRPETNPFAGVTLAPAELSIAEQYEWLRREQGPATARSNAQEESPVVGDRAL